MGYLNNSTITIDATLTKKGRELLARGRDEFKITQFALSDDEIDYNLWNPDHPLGSNYYGVVIENMPLVEASTDESNVMRYKLITLPKTATKIPVISVSQTSVTLNYGQDVIISPSTLNADSRLANSTLGYTAILSNSDAVSITAESVGATMTARPTMPSYIGDADAANSVSVVGLTFKLVGKQNLLSDMNATLTIIGNETGGQTVINILVKKFTSSDSYSTPGV